MKIQVWSDVVCPSCYIGLKQLKEAVSRSQNPEMISIELKTFELNPDFPKNQSIPSKYFLANVKGYGSANVEKMCSSLQTVGSDHNIEFNFDKSLLYNTRDAHRIIQWSKNMNCSLEVEEALFDAYFVRGVDLSQTQNLIDAVASIGLEKSEIREVLESNQFHDIAQKDIKEAQQQGIHSVPYFKFDNQPGFAGFRGIEGFIQLINHSQNSNQNEDNTNSCSIDGECS